MIHNEIYIKGAREHNLKNVTLSIPKHALVVFTGPSGSGKSSLAFDTLFAEGQRRYVESLSSYARQFLGQLTKPDYDELRGLSPTIAIEQKSGSSNPRSTVGTITEIYDYLRVLYARIGQQHCMHCSEPVGELSIDELLSQVLSLKAKTKFLLLAPLVENKKGTFKGLFEELRKDGYTRILIDKKQYKLDDLPKLAKQAKHTILLVVDRLVVNVKRRQRLADSLETALKKGDGEIIIRLESGEEMRFSQKRYCCDTAYPELSQQHFSFNSPTGMCPSCNGLGEMLLADPEKLVTDASLSLAAGCIGILANRSSKEARWIKNVLEATCANCGIPWEKPWSSLSEAQKSIVFNGVDSPLKLVLSGRKRAISVKWEGISAVLLGWFRNSSSDHVRNYYLKLMYKAECRVCEGSRLRRESRAVLVENRSLPSIVATSVTETADYFDSLELVGNHAIIAKELLKELQARLGFLINVGLGYLSLSRPGPTLSGGEAQRIRLASQLGSRLSGVLYVLDEPSIGLHQRDNHRLLKTLGQLRDFGNSVLVVEHDRATMEVADWIVDFGPSAGKFGGEIVFSGLPGDLLKKRGSSTADFLSGVRQIEIPEKRRKAENWLSIIGAEGNNLQHIDVAFPIGCFTCVTGVSGAGKSTLVNEILYPAMSNRLYSQSNRSVSKYCTLIGHKHFDKVINIDQKPIGRTPRSNPATYTKLFDAIRQIFSKLPDSRIYGYKPGRFSFNVKGGRCEACKGAGQNKVEMLFLADVYVCCEACRGERFNEATRRVTYRDYNISDVLQMTIEDAYVLFEAYPKVQRVLQTLLDVGLGYLTLGQSSTTLSGGEAQRIKLSRELAKIATGDTLYIMDEPSTGLHFEDIERLLHVVQRLVNAGNTVVMIEHNLDIIKTADYIVDLGPEGGFDGGKVVAIGSPEEVSKVKTSFTGKYLQALL